MPFGQRISWQPLQSRLQYCTESAIANPLLFAAHDVSQGAVSGGSGTVLLLTAGAAAMRRFSGPHPVLSPHRMQVMGAPLKQGEDKMGNNQNGAGAQLPSSLASDQCSLSFAVVF